MTSDLLEDILEPHTLYEMIGQSELVNAFKSYVKTGYIPDMTISGKPGCGKTLLMKCFAADLGYIKMVDGKVIDLIPGQFYLFNASNSRSIDDVRTTIKRIAKSPVLSGKPRLIVLDEFNYTIDAQYAMRALMQDYSDNTRFILLSNDHSNIIEAILSRCPIKIAQPLTLNDMKIMVERAKKNKDFKISDEAINAMYKITSGDMRAFLKMLQDVCILSNYNVQISHIQNISIDIKTMISILEIAQIDYNQARDVMITVYSKINNAKPILESMYEAANMVRFSDVVPDDEIIRRRIKDRIAEIDFRLTQGTNQLIQLDSLINYIKLIKFVPLQCSKVK